MISRTLTLALTMTLVAGQRITTIQLDGVQYFISRMNPYSPELNYFLAYQYCRSIGLQLASFETKEKADSIMQYLSNAGYNKYDFWTSGNKLGTDMLIWMSTGLPFNATFDYMKKVPGDDMPVARQLGAVEQRKDSGSGDGCVVLRAPELTWDTDDCTNIKDFICEQTRCYYYNYGSIPVSSSQGYSLGSAIKGTTTVTMTMTQSPVTTTVKEDEMEDISEDSFNVTTSTVQPQASSRGRTLSATDGRDYQENSAWPWPHDILLEKPVKAPTQSANPTSNVPQSQK